MEATNMGVAPQDQRHSLTSAWVIRYLLVALLLSTGMGASCSRALRSPFQPLSPPAPEILAIGSSLDQIMAAVNANAGRLQSYQTTNASISVQGMPGTNLSGNIAAQRPGKIRLVGKTALTGPEVDLGANEELFWFWVRRNEPPALYFARHNQLAGGRAQQLMPIEPAWLLDALGFAEFKPTDMHDGPRPIDASRVEITTVSQSPFGAVTKRTVVDARRAWVMEQHVYDNAGVLVASAVAKSHRYYPQANVSLPQEIELRVPAAELALTIDVGSVEVNTLTNNPQLWTMPTIPGAPAVDLGAGNLSATAPKLGTQLSRAEWYGDEPAQSAPAPIAIGASPVVGGRSTLQTVAAGGVPAIDAPVNNPGWTEAAQRLPQGGVPAQTAVR